LEKQSAEQSDLQDGHYWNNLAPNSHPPAPEGTQTYNQAIHS
jgi:hypothetical protein